MSSKYAITRKPDEYILSEESATAEVVRFLTYYDLNVEAISDVKMRENFERALDTVTDYMRRGLVEITDDKDSKINVIQHLLNGETLTYVELGAKHKLAMDRVPNDESYRRLYALMGSLCGLGATAIEKLPPRDLSVVEVLGTVFSNA